MNSLETVIEDFVAMHGRPAQVSLDDFTHIFHFDESDWRKSPVIFVNRNGNYMRLAIDAEGKYRLLKTWNGMFDDGHFGPASPIRHSDPEKSIQLISVGPDRGRKELPSLLPREATRGARIAVFRHHMAKVNWVKSSSFNRFTLTAIDKMQCRSLELTGKVWESVDAVNWFTANMKEPLSIWAPGVPVNPYEREREMEVAMAALEDNPLWGAF